MNSGIKIFLNKYVMAFALFTLIMPPISYMLTSLVAWASLSAAPGFLAPLQFILIAWQFMQLCVIVGLFASLFYAIVQATRPKRNNKNEFRRWGP